MNWRALIIAIMVGLAAFLTMQATSKGAVAQPVRSVAAMVTPRDTIVTCVPLPGKYGESWRDDEGVHIHLSRPICSGLARLASHTIRSWSNSANAIETLLHERDHWPASPPEGQPDEAIVECEALHAMPYWLGRLGYTGASERRLMRLAWATHDTLASQYLGACQSPFLAAVPIARP